MKTVKITCDSCGADLTDTGAMPAYRIRVTAEPLRHTSVMTYDVLVYSPLDHDMYFCGLVCMDKKNNR